MAELNRLPGPDVPTYLEAYPRLDSRDVCAALRGGQYAWSWENAGWRVGNAYVTQDHPEKIQIHSLFWRLQHVLLMPKKIFVSIAPEKSNIYAGKFLFICKCGRSCRTIVYARIWSCRTCSGLRHVSGWLKEEGTAYKRLKYLEQTLRPERNDGMWRATYLSLSAERDQLKERFEKRPFLRAASLAIEVTAHVHHSDEDDPEWRDPSFAHMDWDDDDLD